MNDSIFAPHFDIDPEIDAMLRGIENNNWLVENMLLMPKHEAWIRREVSVKRAAGTARIEGAGMEEADVSDLMKKAPSGRLSENEQANINAVQAYEFVDYLSDQPDIPVGELVIRELDRYFLRGMDPTLTPGVYRLGENKVSEYTPPNQGDVPSLMSAFTTWLQDDGNEIHPIVKASMAHIHLVAIHPFWDGNGRTARALATLILERSRFSFKKLLSLESYMSRMRDDYFTAIERTLGPRFSPDYDATPWLRFFAINLMAHTIEFTQTLTEWHRNMSKVYESFETRHLNHRQADGLAYAARTGRITRPDYIEITNAAPATASRDLARLVEEGYLTPEGKTRGRVYRYVSRTEQPKSEPPSEQGQLFGQTQQEGADQQK